MKQSSAGAPRLHHDIAKTLRAGVCAATLCIFVCTMAQAQSAPMITFNIPEQPLPAALKVFAEQTGIQLLYRPETVNGLTARPIQGQYDKHQALQQMLEDTGLEVVYSAENAATIRPRETESATGEDHSKTTDSNGNARSAGDSAPTDVTQPEAPAAPPQDDSPELTRMVITGTRIRGMELASPIRIIDRAEIDRSGYGTTGDVIRSLPQAFSGNQNPGAFPISGMAPAQNFSAASSADLRGLGPGATLTLLNGRRLPYNGYANTVDIGMIPLPALARIEVVTDGASALYGSDAVAGVVNFILRDDFQGAETTVRFGGSAQGGASERQASQLLGGAWSSGNVLLNVERYEQRALYADQRKVSTDLPDPSMLLPEQERTSALLILNQDISSRLSLFVEALYSEKEVENIATYTYSAPNIFHVEQKTDTRQYGVNAGLAFMLPGRWRGEAVANLSGNKEDFLEMHNIFGPYSVFFDNQLRGVELTAEGPLFSLPAGQVSSAIGAGYREEELEGFFVNSEQKGKRNVKYAYGELSIPLLAHDSTRASMSVSGRYESYDDFGSVFNPKIGLVYLYGSAFKLRGSWGKSFRAPTLYQVHGAREATLYNASTFRVPGAAPDAQAIYLSGANPGLEPERSTSWSAGADFTPESIPGLRFGMTYYEIDYRDRIVSGGNTIGIWDNPQFQHMVIKFPSTEYLETLLQPPTRFNNGLGVPYDPEKVVGVFMVNQRNAPSQDIRGIDLSGSYEWNVGAGYFNAFADFSWLDIRQVDTPGSPERELTGYIYFPAERKGRIGLNWSRGELSATGILNHVSGSTDNTGTFIGGAVNEDVSVGSWTTLDAQIGYSTNPDLGLAGGVRLSLAVRNLLNRAPPAVADASGGALSRGLGFDPQNASALGRFTSLTVSKHW